METPMNNFDSEVEEKNTPTEEKILALEPEMLLLIAGGCYGSGLIHVPK